MRPLNSPELNRPSLRLGKWGNVRSLSQAPSKHEDIAELKRILQITVLTQCPIEKAVSVFKRLNGCVLAKGGHFLITATAMLHFCSFVGLLLSPALRNLLCDCSNFFWYAEIARWRHCNADNKLQL